MKKKSRLALTLALVLTALLAVGCAAKSGSAEFNPGRSSIFIKRDGSVMSASVEHTEQNYYSEDELKGFLETELSAFNAAQGSESAAYNKEGAAKLPAALVSCEVKGADGNKTVKAVYEYSSADMLMALAGQIKDEEIKLTALATDSVENRLGAGDLVGETFTDTRGKSVESGKVTSQSKLRAVSCQGPAVIQTEGKVLYISEGCKMVDSYTVETPEEGSSYIIFK